MAAIPTLLREKIRGRIFIRLVNSGDSELEEGWIIGKYFFKDGTVRSFNIYNETVLAPGEVANLDIRDFDQVRSLLKRAEVSGYQTNSQHTFPLRLKATPDFWRGWTFED